MAYLPKVGETVRIREWDDMEKEFGLNENGSIRCSFFFTEEMGFLCGKEFIVGGIDDDGEIFDHDLGYHISTDMIEPVEEPIEELEYNTEPITDFLNQWCVD